MDKKCHLKIDLQTTKWYADAIKQIEPELLALRLPQPALRALINAKIYKRSDLKKISEQELSDLHGMGPKSIEKLKRLLGE